MEPEQIAQRYRRFADLETPGVSATFGAWARSVVDDRELLTLLATLPDGKAQPNLVFAAARWHGAIPGAAESLRHVVIDHWPAVRGTILHRSTQTNEAARCAVQLVALHRIPGPIALIELGASAGLCLVPDRYSYRYSDGSVMHPPAGPSRLVIECRVIGGTPPATLRVPDIVWRAGLDRHPLDATDPDARAWLENLIWPEHDIRRRRLHTALAMMAADPVRIDRGDIRHDIGKLLGQVPEGSTPVVLDSMALVYLNPDDRAAVIAQLAASHARWVSFERRDVIPLSAPVPQSAGPQECVVTALDQEPVALSDGHGAALRLLSPPRGAAH